ncbi:phage protein Gp27 family protein [Lysinibacillus boronitolerans]|uniref:phage protein Gp27 family protein n=1 Tax=Lysinibacillus boronitolerans TaxID=309788 RepID=UPI00289825B8|nr:phage protein Gp27 family protein [Lysinibacillus boronitolerans]
MTDKAYKKYRKHNKVFSLPDELRKSVDEMLLDTSITYLDISKWLAEKGQPISKSTIGRYALETKQLAHRLLETQARVQELVKVAKHNQDDEGLTEAALQISVHKLSERIALIEEELDDLPPEAAIDLMIKLSRAKAYKDKTYATLKSEFERAYESFKKSVYAELQEHYPEVAAKLIEIADETLGKVYEK